MINSLFPVFSGIDAIFNPWAPEILVIIFWGVIAGAVTMFIYALVSNGEALAVLKDEAKSLRKRMLNPDLPAKEFKIVAARNLSASLRLFGRSFVPAAVSSIPVLLIVFWLDAYKAYQAPHATTPVSISHDESRSELTFTLDGEKLPVGMRQLPLSTESLLVINQSGAKIYSGQPANPATGIIHKKRWWNALLANEAGYLADAAKVDSISFRFTRKRLVAYGPTWATTWELPFFVSLMITALVVKVGFRIE